MEIGKCKQELIFLTDNGSKRIPHVREDERCVLTIKITLCLTDFRLLNSIIIYDSLTNVIHFYYL